MKPRKSTTPESKGKLFKIMSTTNGICYLCGQPLSIDDVTIDHVIPKSLGGSNEHHNKLPAHSVCNKMKSNMTYEQFLLQCSQIVNNAIRNMVFSEVHKAVQEIKNRQHNNTSNDKAQNQTSRNTYPKRNEPRRIEKNDL